MFGFGEHYEKWMDTAIFQAPLAERHAYLQLVHMKCFAVSIMNSCVMNILVVNQIQLYLMRLLGFGSLITLLSPQLMWKIIPVIFLILSFYIPYLRGNINFRYGTYYIYCLICCMELQGFEFLFDLYMIICYITEAIYAFYTKRHLNVLATVISEFGIWTIDCSKEFRLLATFAYLAIEAFNYRQLWALSTFYVTLGGYMFLSHMYGIELEDQLKQLGESTRFLVEFFVTNASISVIPEKKFYKSS